MKAIYLAAALSMSGFALAAAPASAAPVAPVAIQATQPSLLQVQYSHRDDHRRPRYVPGHRYREAPRGWHRYDRRPRDWNRRGCIMVGPVWFCE